MNPPTTAEPTTRARLVDVEVRDGIAVLTMNDPPANNYTHEMMRDLDEGILQARFDDTVNVIVVTGAGEKFFSSGANIKMLASVTPVFKYFFCLHANETLSRLEQTPKLVIGALNGHTVGGGLEIALACDLRIARKGGGKVGVPEINLGVLPGTGGTQRLSRIVGKARAIELMTTGRLMEFEEALSLGLVNQVLEAPSADAFKAMVLEWAKQFTTPGKAAMAVGHIKRAVQSGFEIPLEYGLALERELQAKLFSSADAKEGLTAYTQKRAAKFQGK
ncbi:MAG TPA: enoyl-CoA hydratase/isomerase family protein [Planctomycetota bacterium]|jgi:enoyl-CoA hydratase/carnithine racemase|nr:enoyl-CoA hydratase/isomerase family protein [Planctomycetota bacterium]